MKRILALTIALVMLAASLCGCSLYYRLFGYDTNYKGEIYTMYFGDMPTTLDPKDTYVDESSFAVMSMIYSGLYKYEEDGSVTEDLAEECKELSFDETTGELEIEISIRSTRWSDEVYVQADQFIYAWRRLLEPTSSSTAASLLFDIKNARETKSAIGSTTKYDLAVYAVDTRMLHITLQGVKLEDGKYSKPDVELFKAKLASPYLVPVRSDKVSKLTLWATSYETVPSCGPFYLKSYNQVDNARTQRGAEIVLQRNKFYLRDEESDPIDKYVKPYQIVLNYSTARYQTGDGEVSLTSGTPLFDTPAQQAAYYLDKGYMDYICYIPLEQREQYKSQVTTHDMPFTHAYLFNTENELLKKADVRRALSMAIDRTELSNRLVFAKAAVSIVSPVVNEKGVAGEKFVDHLTSSVSATAQLEEAKALLQKAGVTSGSFTIAVKSGDAEAVEAAKYCCEVWSSLGFDVSLYAPTLSVKSFSENDYDCRYDTYYECYKANGKVFNINVPSETVAALYQKGFDVIAVDVLAGSTDAFTTLAPFSKYFSGMQLDMDTANDEVDPALPMSSYKSSRYDEIIMKAFESAGPQTRANYLHAAEEVLMEDMPIMPLFYHQYSVIVSSDIKNVSYGYGGVPRLAEVEHKDYSDDLTVDYGDIMAPIKDVIIESRRKELGLGEE